MFSGATDAQVQQYFMELSGASDVDQNKDVTTSLIKMSLRGFIAKAAEKLP